MEWRDIEEFPLYAVSSTGSIRNRTNGLLKPYEQPTGYLRVTLVATSGGARKGCLVHRLVASAFIPKIAGSEFVNHKDGDRSNNVVSNLEWVTNLENSTRKTNPAKTRKGRPVLQLDASGTVLKEWATAALAARELGLHPSSIGSCCRDRRKTTGKFFWAYAESFEHIPDEIWRKWKTETSTGEVSNMGRLRSSRGALVYGSINGGYVRYGGAAVHRLVAEAFPELCPHPDHCDVVNHKDGNKANNEVTNLEWATHSENGTHAYETGLNPKQRSVRRCSDGTVFPSIAEAVRRTGAAAQSIVRSCKSDWRIAKGSRWEYVNVMSGIDQLIDELLETFVSQGP